MTVAFELRPSTGNDFEFVYRLNESSFRRYVERARGWDESAERRAMRALFRPGVDMIVVANGYDIGIFAVDRYETKLHLRHVELLPEYAGREIGSALIRDLLDEARDLGLPVTLRVTKANTNARRLYERLGFRTFGETPEKLHMNTGPDG